MGVNILKHITKHGDSFDILALDYYDDEYMSYIIIEANPNHADTIIFETGVELIIPMIQKVQTATLPPWKR